ncbi:ABC transporter permease [Oleidesulfovibrio sp.]|uniref:ABC transporter permease n=1 Tax=Oleidesulfovibrio sp. TaxID=2909707 RepID=UPI003A8448D4
MNDHGTRHRVVLEPRSGVRSINVKELWEYRDLLMFLVWRSIRVRYAQSLLGVGWAVIQPLFSMVVFTVVFGNLAKVDSEGVPYAVFSFTALVPWTYFSNALVESAGSLVGNANMIRKVYFPRLVLPLSAVIAKLVDFGIAMIMLLAIMAWYGVAPTWGVIYLPLLVFFMMATATGIGMWLTALSIQYRDVHYSLNFVVQLLMYAAPVVYPVSLIPVEYRLLYGCNPMVGVIEGFRSALLGTVPMPWDLLALGGSIALFLSFTGALYFRSKEKIFADVA